jgi:hypothetical protein
MGDIGPELAHYEVLPLHDDVLVPVEVAVEATAAPQPVEPEPAR